MNKLLISTLAFAAFALTTGADAARYRDIHVFCAKTNCPDGAAPFGAPVGDGKGDYFGTTVGGGRFGGGTVYRMTLASGKWQQSVLYSFCAKSSCPDGSAPQGNLVIDTSANLYGIARNSGKNSGGVVFELSPGGSGWTYRKLYDFCSAKSCADGFAPVNMSLTYRGAASGVPYDGASPLYGTTAGGGATSEGVVFSLAPLHGVWTETAIHSFCQAKNCADGAVSVGGVAVDGSGNLFGSTVGGGKYARGTLWQLAPSGKKWIFTTLHHFCADQSGCADGAAPESAMIQDGTGALYGTTAGGGTNDNGVVFQLVPNGAKSHHSVIYTFCQQTGCTDGSVSLASLALDGAGNLYGATEAGGANDSGILFRLNGPKFSRFTTLVSFGGTDTTGTAPISLTLDATGALFGAANSGGPNNEGTAFQYTP
jgi:uncharacterized repeat protein (TIGR03803 family)